MKSILHTFLIVVLPFLFSGAAVAAPINIDFESESLGALSPLSVDGFTFSSFSNAAVTDFSGDQKFGTLIGAPCDLFACGPLLIDLKRDDDGAFALYGADVIWNVASGFGDLSISGVKVGGGFAAGPVGSADWLNLESVSFSVLSLCGACGADVLELYIDNVSVQAVPIPAAVWLFGSALAGLGWMKRRKTV